jgi:hypothetical protein
MNPSSFNQDGTKKRFPAELAGKASRKGLRNIFVTVEGTSLLRVNGAA